MKILKLLFILTLILFVGGIIAFVILKKNPKTIAEKLQQMMMKMCEKMCKKMMLMDCCKTMMNKHCK